MLKQFLSKHFDQQFLDRKKGGFSLPLQHWFSEGGALRQELKDRFLLGTARIHRYMRPDVVKKLVTEHVQTRKSSQTLWQLLFLENWLEHVHDAAIGKRTAISQRIVVLQ
jgi:asparagine synthetase B (glutamine-hydrolysing)